MGGSQNSSDTEVVGELVKVESSFTLSALDGLADTDAIVLEVAGNTLKLNKVDVEALSSTDIKSISTQYGELVLNGYTLNTDGTITIDYEYTLTSAPENAEAGDGTDAGKFTDDTIKITVKDRDGDDDNQNLVIRIMDDVPTVSATGTHPANLVVDESTMGASAEGSFASAFKHHFGADGAATTDSFVYSLAIDNTAEGLADLKDTLTGAPIKLELEADGTVKGVVDGGSADGETIFTVTVGSDGKVTLAQARAMHHDDPDKVGADDVLTLPVDSIKLTATITDKDGDTDTASVDIGDKLTFQDDGPSLDDTNTNLDGNTFTDNATVDEKHLPSGSDTNLGALTVTKDLPIDFGADGAVNFDDPQNPTTGLTFNESNIAALGELELKSGTKPLIYKLSDDGHTITAKAGSNDIFTIELKVATDGTPSYEFTLKGPLDHNLQKDANGDYSAENIVLPFDITATDGDGDSVSLKFKVEVVDDTPETADLEQTVNEDGSISFSNADINTTTTKVNDDAQPEHGVVTIGDDGTVTYTPHEDYRGSDSYTYTVTTGGVSYERKVDVTVKPVADKPLFANGDGEYPEITGVKIGKDGSVQQGTYDYSVQTNEDVSVGLGLHVPKVKDDGTDPGNNDTPELLGAITLKFNGLAADYTPKLQLANGTDLTPAADGSFQIVIVNNATEKTPLDWHLDIGLPDEDTDNGVHYLTEEQYKGLRVDPAAERHENFKVEVSVDSFEVDADGKQLDGVSGANSKQVIDVKVQAVTDPIELKIDTDKDTHSYEMDEDTTFNLKDHLTVNYPDEYVNSHPERDNNDGDGVAGPDLDGSEKRWFEITGLPEGAVVNGTTVTGPDHVISIEAPGLSTSNTELPDINITPPKDFSGDMTSITVTLKAQDQDSDDGDDNGLVEKDSITLNLHVNPVAGDVGLKVNDITTLEDTAVNFMRNIEVTDKKVGGSNEVITKVVFELPEKWKLTKQPAAEEAGDATWEVTGNDTDGYTITFTGGSEENRELALSKFEVTPPAHSSADKTITVTVTTEDTNIVKGTEVPSDTVDTELAIKVEVTPVAEVIGDGSVSDTDGDGTADLTMTNGHSYETAGEEDTWFNLNQDGFALKTGWRNQDGKDAANGNSGADGSEETFALLTPELIAGDGSQANANGAKFQWTENGVTKTVTFGGDPIEVPIEFLDTLQFKAPENFAGMFKIKVEAKTVDYDEDDPSIKVEAISGEALLENVLIAPKADTSTTSLTARVEGNEDETMPLSIRPKSSDPAEIFDVTVSAVPNGAMLTYGDYVITEEGVFNKSDLGDDGRLKEGSTEIIVKGISVEADGADNWKVSFEDFDSKKDMTVTAPLDSNEEFELTVSTQTVDVLKIPAGTDLSGFTMPAGVVVVGDKDSGYTLTSKSTPPEELTIDVAPKGVADPAIVELGDTAIFTEEKTDQNGIKLNELFTTLALKDNDGSETLSFKIGGLPAGFTVKGATFMGNGTWSFGTAEYNAGEITIHPPQNYNGKFSFDFYTITTENDGDSLTKKHEINVTVTPSPEAGMNLASSGDEDTSFQLDFGVKHENGDDDEFVSKVFIKVDSVTDDLTLTLGENGTALSTTEAIGGANYYVVEQSDLNNIYAKGKANWSGKTSFNVRYEITDPGKDGLDNVSAVTDTDDTYDVTINPVTDQVTLAVTEGAETTLAAAGTVNVKLSVGNEGQDGGDYDDSEVLTRIIVDDVPDGVVLTNTGAHFIGGRQWVIVSDTEMNGVLEPVIKFQVHSSAGGLTGHEMTVTVISEDAGNGVETTASKTVKLTTTFEKGDAEDPAKINTWEQTTFEPTEDTAFTLNEAINAEIESGVTDNGFTVTLTDLPAGTVVEGMQKTTVDGKDLWSATGSGGNAELQTLLNGIKVTPPLDWNSNKGEFKYDATLTTHVPSGGRAQESITVDQTVKPEADEAVITIDAPTVDEGADVVIKISVTNPADEHTPGWTIVDNKLYLQVESAVEGKLYDSTGNTLLETENVTGVDGIDDGDYYVIDLEEGSTSAAVVFKPDNDHDKGNITIKTWVKTEENGATNIATGNSTSTTAIQPVNSGYELEITSSTGTENPSSNKATDGSNLIEVEVGGGGLKDTTGTEKIDTILLDNLPNGFLVYVGADAASATEAKMANNAGGESTNTWLLGDEMPKYIGILPPKNWSGTLEGIEFTVISGESSLAEKDESTEKFDLVVNPQADGVEIKPTASFGQEGEIIGFNLNANLKDLHQAGDSDQHVELITLQISGMGDYAAFYVGDELISGTERVIFDESSGTYTIKGLSQDDVDNLGFVQAKDSIDVAGIKVKAQSQEYEVGTDGKPDLNNPAKDADGNDIVSAWTGEKTITTNITSQYGTTDDDRLLYTDSFIDGRGGEDTIQLRFGEDVTGSELADNLKNIEIIDMSGEASGANSITGLTAKDVFNMTDGDNLLKILGDEEDSVTLSEGWEPGTDSDGFTTYTAMHGESVVKLEVQTTLIE